MKLALAFILSSLTLSSFASTLSKDIQTKECLITMNKTVTLSKKEMGKDIGQLSLLSLYHSKKLSLKSGQSYQVLDASEGTIGLNINENIVFLCVIEGETCMKDISKIKTQDIEALSGSALKMECR